MTTNQQTNLKTPNASNSKFNEMIQQQIKKQSKIPVLGKTEPVPDMRNPKSVEEIQKKIEQSKILNSSKQSTPANGQNNRPGQSQKECSFCRKTGFNILPLRYTVVRGNAPALPAT